MVNAVPQYESPSTDVTPRGPDGLFTPGPLNESIAVLDRAPTTAGAV